MPKTFIIAEAGVNHDGSIDSALRLVDAAKEAGADAVKFQTWWGFPKLQHLELPRDEFAPIKEHCDDVGIQFMSTPDTIEAADFLAELEMSLWKIGSRNAVDESFLRKIAALARETYDPEWRSGVILSTGMCNEKEVIIALDFLGFVGKTASGIGITRFIPMYVLHCTSQYPCPPSEANLRAMRNIGSFGLPFGLSDHTLGIHIPIAAVAMGASIIEKHFTLSKGQDGPDHHMSLEPFALAEMVRCIRDVEAAMGDGVKRPTENELKVRDRLRNYEDCK